MEPAVDREASDGADYRIDLRAPELSPRRRPAGASERIRAALADISRVPGAETRGRQWFPHPFPARMPYPVAAVAVEALTSRGMTILDPMSGSGTVPYAALQAGRRTVARDIDPLATLLGRALCAPTCADALAEYCADIHADAVQRLATSSGFSDLQALMTTEERAFLRYWFPKSAVRELFALAEAIISEPRHPLATVGAVIFSSLIISRGSGVSRALDLSRSRPHRDTSKKTKRPLDHWLEKSELFSDYYDTREAQWPRDHFDIALGDARDLKLPDCSIDAVITSPPYLNAIDYIRTSKFSLVFFGASLSALRGIRSESIGTEVGLPEGVLPSRFDVLVRRRVADDRRRPLVRRYLQDMRQTFTEMHRVLKPGAPALLVLGPYVASRARYDSAEIIGALAEECGFEVCGNVRRALSPSNRSLPPPRRSFASGALDLRMNSEVYLGCSKADL